MARVSKYNESCDAMAYGYCSHGATNEELAKFFDISDTTLKDWITKHKSLAESVLSGKLKFDTNRVQSALLKKALGGDVEEITEKTDPNGNKTVTVKKMHIWPDTGACIFWLKNRQPDLWRDKIEQSVTVEEPIDENKARELMRRLVESEK